MNKLLVLLISTICISAMLIQKAQAQDIQADLKSLKANYDNELSKGFKISFKNGKNDELKDVGLKFGETAIIIKEQADLTNFEIKFSFSNGSLSTKDKDGKEIKISGNQFKITLGNDLNFNVSKPNILAIDVSDIKASYDADLKRDFKISFKKSDTKSRKVSIISKSGKESILNSQADLTKFIISLTNKDGVLVTKDEKGNEVKIDEKEIPFSISIDGKKITVKTSTTSAATTNKTDNTNSDEKKEKIPYWSYLKDNNMNFSLENQMITPSNGSNCCDECGDCDDDAFMGNNRIIYNAKSGLTYFVPADKDFSDRLCGKTNIDKYKDYKVSSTNKIRLNAGDPLVYIVENVNPALYNLELSDSTFLMNNESTGLLESLLLSKSEDAVSLTGDKTVITGGADEEAKKENEIEYLKVKTGLIIVKAEMIRLLENLRRSSPYLHNCVQQKKRDALDAINKYPTKLLGGKYKDFSFIQIVDVFLNQETEDSTLNHQIKALYGEFIAASYKIAYRYPQIPEKDLLTFKLSIVAKSNSPYPSLLNVKMQDPTQTVYVKNFFKVDVSSGLYLGFMKDQTYALQSDTLTIRNIANTGDSLTNIKRILKEDDGKLEIGFASYLHLYYKFSNWINLGGTIGAGISFDKTVRPRYFTGLSLLLGTNNRLCINGGLVWGNYEDLSNQYKKVDNNYSVLKDTETSLNYTTRFKHAGFISISYNLPFLKRKTDVKPKDNTTTSTSTSSTTSSNQ